MNAGHAIILARRWAAQTIMARRGTKEMGETENGGDDNDERDGVMAMRRR